MGKPILTEAALNRCDIFYNSQPSSLPPHIQDLKCSLLDLDFTEFGNMGELDENQDWEQLKETFWSSQYKQVLQVTRRSTIKAISLTTRQDRESEWQNYFFEYFCKPLIAAAEVTDEDDYRTARAKYYYDHFENASQRPWPLFAKHTGYKSVNRPGLSMPVPDWMAAFPVFSEEYFKTLPLPPKWLTTVQPKHAMVTNLSQRTLQHLAAHGLYSIVANSLRKQAFTNASKLSDHMCFPWLIMEHKQHQRSEEHCYSQAANATSAAVQLFERLCEYEASSGNQEHVSPVIGITTIASHVKIWITYSTSTSIKMDCIWTGDVQKPVVTLQLHCILENIRSWATRVLRPWISLHIDQWLVEKPFGCPVSPTRQSQEVRQNKGQDGAVSSDDSLTLTGHLFDVPETPVRQEDRRHLLPNLDGGAESEPSASIHGINALQTSQGDDDDDDNDEVVSLSPNSRNSENLPESRVGEEEDNRENDDWPNTNSSIDEDGEDELELVAFYSQHRIHDETDGDDAWTSTDESVTDAGENEASKTNNSRTSVDAPRLSDRSGQDDGDQDDDGTQASDGDDALSATSTRDYNSKEGGDDDELEYDSSTESTSRSDTDAMSTPPRRIGPFLPTTPPYTGSTFASSAWSAGQFNFTCPRQQWQRQEQECNQTPTKTSSAVQKQSPPAPSSSSSTPPSKRFRPSVFPEIPDPLNKKYIWRGKNIWVRIRRNVIYAATFNPLGWTAMGIMTQPADPPEVSSGDSRDEEYLFRHVFGTPVPCVKLPTSST